MNYIGEGFYYRVYEYNTNRVFKKFQPYWSPFLKVYTFTRRRNATPIIKAIVKAHTSVVAEKRELLIIKNRLQHVPLSLFANPSFTGSGLDYMQDKVTVMADYFKENSTDQDAKAIDGYIDLQTRLWAYGLHDTTYKLQQNYGVDKQGNVACIDFGEFVFTKAEALKSIASQKWLSRQSYINWSDADDLKQHYIKRMTEIMTNEHIDKAWGSSLKQ